MKATALLGLVLLVGCATPANGLTWVSVAGPPDAQTPEDLVLEIGDAAWLGYGGVVSVSMNSSTEVRLIGRDTCRTYAQFEAKPGSRTVLRLATDGQVAIEDWTGRGIDAGPRLADRPPSRCPVA